jgi:hypothetical protein
VVETCKKVDVRIKAYQYGRRKGRAILTMLIGVPNEEVTESGK